MAVIRLARGDRSLFLKFFPAQPNQSQQQDGGWLRNGIKLQIINREETVSPNLKIPDIVTAFSVNANINVCTGTNLRGRDQEQS
jgi:hypothetical protein